MALTLATTMIGLHLLFDVAVHPPTAYGICSSCPSAWKHPLIIATVELALLTSGAVVAINRLGKFPAQRLLYWVSLLAVAGGTLASLGTDQSAVTPATAALTSLLTIAALLSAQVFAFRTTAKRRLQAAV